MNIAEISVATNIVSNVSVWDDVPQSTNETLYVQTDSAGIGWTYNPADESFSSPEPAPPGVPHSVSMRQARLALLGAGLLDSVDAVVAQSPRAVQIEWEFATDVWRDRDLVASIGGALGLTDDQIDALFIAAAAIP